MAPGIHPDVQQRWDELWSWIEQQELTHQHQIERLRELKVLLQRHREGFRKAAERQAVEDLIKRIRLSCLRGFPGDRRCQLFACPSSMGLIFVHAKFSALMTAVGRGPLVILNPLQMDGNIRFEQVTGAEIQGGFAALPEGQVRSWALAAAWAGYLFTPWEPDDDADSELV
jgi:hypothetical protein